MVVQWFLAPVTSRVFEPRDPSERSGPAAPVLDRAVLPYSTDGAFEHKGKEFHFGLSRMSNQNNLNAFGRHSDP
jgi:hypothetical protein